MRAIPELVVLIVVALAVFGLWSATSPDAARRARDGTVRAVDRLSRESSNETDPKAAKDSR